MKKYGVGLVVGKFCPLTHGHEHLIDTAAAACRRLIVLSYTSQNFRGCDVDERRWWLSHYYGRNKNIDVLVLDGIMPDDNDPEDWHREFCLQKVLEHFNSTVDAIFTSETYGDGFAEYATKWYKNASLGDYTVDHVCVDLERTEYPVSGTKVRAGDPEALMHVSPLAKSSLKKRIVILGGESSGKTTLAEALAARLDTIWVPEYGRELCAELGGVDKLRYQDMERIAEMQVMSERVNGVRANGYIVCDTSPLTTKWYSKQLFGGRVSKRLEELSKRRYDMTFVCANDIPFEQDGTRADEGFRKLGFDWYCRHLFNNDVPYYVVSGTLEQRLHTIVEHLS